MLWVLEEQSQFYGHFPVIPLYNSMVKKFGSHKMTAFYVNPGYNKVCYKETIL